AAAAGGVGSKSGRRGASGKPPAAQTTARYTAASSAPRPIDRSRRSRSRRVEAYSAIAQEASHPANPTAVATASQPKRAASVSAAPSQARHAAGGGLGPGPLAAGRNRV